MKGIIIVLIVLSLLLVGCAETYNLGVESNGTIKDSAYDLCVERGGVPIRSGWDGRLTNCILFKEEQ